MNAGGLGKARRLRGGNTAGRRGRHEVAVLGVDGRGVVGAEAEFLDGARVGEELGLPAVVGLVFLYGGLGGRVPLAVGIAAKVVLADESLLNLRHAVRVDGLLASRAARRSMLGVGEFVRAARRANGVGAMDGRTERERRNGSRNQGRGNHNCPSTRKGHSCSL